MHANKEPYQGIPLLYTEEGSPFSELSSIILAEGGETELRSIWNDFRAELLKKIEALGEIQDPEPLLLELHSLRGMSAQFGFTLLESFLFFWEQNQPDPIAVMPRFFPITLSIAKCSSEAMDEKILSLCLQL